MIPAGHTAVDFAGLARIHGLAPGTLANKINHMPGHPPPLNTRGHRKLWDQAQARAYVAGQPIPPLPNRDHPDDLLNDYEAAEVAGIKPSTWRFYAREGYIHGSSRTICGMRHWPRHTVEAHRDRPKLPGRTVGAKDTRPRRRAPDPRRARVAELLRRAAAGGPAVTARDIAAAHNISTRTAERWLAQARRELANQHPDP